VKSDGLGIFRAPVLVENLGAVFGCNKSHNVFSCV
jgi:hypothetical protein